jgi:hypothetical protein
MADKPAHEKVVYCKGGIMLAWHHAGQNIDPVEVYGEGTVTAVDDGTFVYERVDDVPPPEGQPDTRPFKCPFDDSVSPFEKGAKR